VVYDFERSVISDPTATRDTPAKIFDLHFVSSASMPASIPKKRTDRSWKLNLSHAAAVNLWPPDGIAPADMGPGEIERQVIDRVQKQQGRHVAISSRTILRAAGRP
jgi:hypothetical protein